MQHRKHAPGGPALLDIIIAGAGPVGCVLAEQAARRGYKVLIIESRSHIAGNCFDEPHESGVLVHRYGPHYFRTNKRHIVDYLSRFTRWIPGSYFVKSFVDGRLFPFPINLTTLEMFFGRELDESAAKRLLDGLRVPFAAPGNSEEQILASVGRELYEAFYRGYTRKQWGRPPAELDPSVCGRIPVRFNRDCRYVEAEYQLMPAEGFTEMFRKMIAHRNITVWLNTDFHSVQGMLGARRAVIYTGPIDRYFGYRHGPLPWRSLDFEFRERRAELVQPCVQINYPNEHGYTRSVEIKHVTGQKHPHTVVTYEYPCSKGAPYYPVPCAESHQQYARYAALARRETEEKQVYFAGRLAQYRYINTDEAIEIGLELARELFAKTSEEPNPLPNQRGNPCRQPDKAPPVFG